MSYTLALILLVGGVLGLVGFVVSLICVAIVVGMSRSTHTVVPYTPMEEKLAEIEDEIAAEEESRRAEEEKLFNSVGRKKKPKEEPAPTLDLLDDPIAEINQQSTRY